MPTTYPDVRAVDKAILAILTGDPILAALMPGGVHWDIAPIGLTQFVTVTLQDFVADYVMGADDSGTETIGYLIKAISRASAADAALDAAARIHDLLHRQPLNLTGTGYELMVMQRSRRVRYSEFDQNNTEWQHIGGVYDVMVSAATLSVM